MNIEQPTQENANFLLKEITTKLKMVNSGVFEHLQITEIDYQALLEIYQLISRKSTFSPREMQMYAEELRNIRK
ncbi:DUF1128 family protein [Listeria sp. PSOL-1]|uniref:DUF1128 family protein n=1 Tax=Listeria sp. PSOL-1 TaxID=1844999 RepID=UPI0013D81C2A|nr:DUF1128 family protein [Listeria sp. PSOL-1]